ncbi:MULTISPECIES: ribbon-helix-helix domain-containing protein [Commensalibacter]|uniref:Ribbon-helix-helix domain-containing protein n=2 Tax=Commensalibacter TaxID=1079922 RepID=W7E263_9PROT|nr:MULTISPECIES: ribbon-helix-helix domain-containing protein [Commensalibacter]EUK19139.1 hypothetical protein COMX_05295 [Commensalibacter papalotli (ex Servin-Garciduenas et al. 2014)]CAI3930076.1 Predicted DNA-binding protein [Commensalibacter papalotli (ex Botero et al. 2024)]CAI3948538.1 Predicted DNA-binding protein [Commensalibacter papalotli (ex Botero et al. 2024)]
MTNPYLQKRSLRLSGHQTSVALEQEFWKILEQIALQKQQSLTSFITHVDTHRPPDRPLSSALRLEALKSTSILTK